VYFSKQCRHKKTIFQNEAAHLVGGVWYDVFALSVEIQHVAAPLLDKR
jgi:hypothetical protein